MLLCSEPLLLIKSVISGGKMLIKTKKTRLTVMRRTLFVWLEVMGKRLGFVTGIDMEMQ
jgi:hypothetical protein